MTAWHYPLSRAEDDYISSGYINSDISTPLRWVGQDAPVVRVGSAVSQEIGDGAWVALTFDTAVEDPLELFDVGSPSRITFRHPGLYWVQGVCKFEPNSTGIRALKLRIDGNQDVIESGWLANTGGATSTTIQAQTLINITQAGLDAGAGYLETLVLQSSGNPTNSRADGIMSPCMSAIWLRDDVFS